MVEECGYEWEPHAKRTRDVTHCARSGTTAIVVESLVLGDDVTTFDATRHRVDASAIKSPKTPAAVTCAPAPGPRMMSGVDAPVGP